MNSELATSNPQLATDPDVLVRVSGVSKKSASGPGGTWDIEDRIWG